MSTTSPARMTAVAVAAAILSGMLAAGWGRVVNISSGIAANPAGMVRGNAYATTKAALEAPSGTSAPPTPPHDAPPGGRPCSVTRR